MNTRLSFASIALIAVVTVSACTAETFSDTRAAAPTASANPTAAAATPRPTPTTITEPTAFPSAEPTATPSPEPTGADIHVVKKDTEFLQLVPGGNPIHGKGDIKFTLTLKNDGTVASKARCTFTVSDSFSSLPNSPFVNTDEQTATLKPVIKPGETVETTYTFSSAPVMIVGTNVSWNYGAACDAAG